ncbi:MAG: DUF938 domain-containing protein [Pseudomonadota bacterium]
MGEDPRRFAPAAARNREPILEVLRRVLPARGKVLEIGCGSGEHAVFFARAMPSLAWFPSDPDTDARVSTAAWIGHEALTNVAPPVAIDVRDDEWGVENEAPFDAIISLNMVHIAPWACALGLIQGAARLSAPGAILFLYGPFKMDGRHTSPSNEAFDTSLKARNAEWGVRDMEEIKRVAEAAGFVLDEIASMPANNFSLVFKFAAATSR